MRKPDISQYEHTGTVFGAIGGRQFEALRVLDPDSNAVAAFHQLADELDRCMRYNVAESRALAIQRDALLPRLVSGEVRVVEVSKEGPQWL